MSELSTTPRPWRKRQSLILITLAVLATLIAIFYLEEDWRGKRAWEKTRQELEAKGAIVDWEKIVPPPVPDDQNFFMASTNIRIRFVRTRNDEEYRAATNLTWLVPDFKTLPVQVFSKTNAPVIAELNIIPSTAKTSTGLRIKLGDAAAPDQVAALLRATLGHTVSGAAGFPFSERDVTHLPPAQIFVESDATISTNALQRLIPSDLATNNNIGQLTVMTTTDPAKFVVALTSGKATTAAEYLQWSDQFTPGFDEVREALKRPYAIIPGDFSEPYRVPIPNFVVMRWIAQTLAQRTQCHILLGEPEKALPDLALMHDFCRILEHRPTHQPMTLVEAMINVAIAGLYVDTIRPGLSNHVWKEPELAALQAQCKEIELGPNIYEAFHFEQGNAIRLGKRENFEKIFISESFSFTQTKPWYQTIWTRTGLWLMPQGWLDQNIKNAAEMDQGMLDSLDRSSAQVDPQKIDAAMHNLQVAVDHRSVFNLLATIAIPNFSKALQTYAMNQTFANEGQIACALERYRLAHGGYPETLDTLSPQFMDKVPADLIGGQPLHYKRTADGKFLLYSVGWNTIDDGGITVEGKTYNDHTQGDWVWKN
jgi:hypothetical protein